MAQISVPPMVDRPDLRSTMDLLRHRLDTDPSHIAFAQLKDGNLTDISTADFHSDVRRIARGLAAAGIEPGDRVAVMSPTRYEWALAAFAIWQAGAVVVPVYETSSVTQATDVLRECEVTIALGASSAHRETLLAASDGLRVWTFDPDDGSDLAALIALGEAAPLDDAELERRGRLAGPDDLASIVFTSGTTGRNKGVRITHGNFVGLVVQVAAAYEEVVNDQASTIILLPLAHVLAQGLQLVSVFAGMKIVHVGDPRAAVAAMAQVRPTFMVVVPRILEKIRSQARAKAHERHLGRLFAAAERTAMQWGEHLERVQDQPELQPARWLAVRHRMFDRLFYRRLRDLMGGRVDYLLSGASPLDANLGTFFRGAGIPVLEGYGLTETTAPVTGNRPGLIRAGTVGIPIPGSSVRIAEDGEVLVRGVGVSPGYLRTQDDADRYVDGYYRTGDIGSLDEQGFLTIKGRIKNLIVTSHGKNIAPEPWERSVMAEPVVGEAIVVGDGRPYATALIVLDTDEAIAWARRLSFADLARSLTDAAGAAGSAAVRIADERVVSHVQRAVDLANAAVSRAEQVRRFAVLVTAVPASDPTITPTLKRRRAEFLAAMAPHIASLYPAKDRP